MPEVWLQIIIYFHISIKLLTVDSLITHTPRPLADGVCVSNETKKIIPEHSQRCVLHEF
jgi:hypothetical protein